VEKILIITNPTSGDKTGVQGAERLKQLFEQKDVPTMLYETTGEDDFKSLLNEAQAEGFQTVAILGGDGTISEFNAQISDLAERPDILLVPMGTTNNLARTLKTELDFDLFLEKVKNNNLVKKKADVGQINDKYFISTLSAGSLPEIAWKADDEIKEMLGSFGYILEGISAINEDETFELTIKTEDDEKHLEDITLVVVGLSNSVFGIPTFFDGGQIDDGKLYLYALQTSNLMEEAASLGRHIVANKENDGEEDNELSYITSFKKATIEATTDLNLTIDGEKGPTFPVELSILQKHLTFLVPEANEV
jgi:YegS/Rv2252/BmrU family lipid kinase